MHATPVIPGFLYHVKGSGLDLHLVADHGCTAICTALALLGA